MKKKENFIKKNNNNNKLRRYQCKCAAAASNSYFKIKTSLFCCLQGIYQPRDILMLNDHSVDYLALQC